MLETDKIFHKKSSDGLRLDDAAQYVYGNAFRDQYLLHDPKSLPRYGHLVRKAMMHYGRERYNPHQHGLMHEPFLRGIFKDIISYKVLHRAKAYDWE